MEDRHDSMEARLLNSKREPIVDEQARFVRASATPAGGFICCFGQRSSLYRGRDVATKNAGRFPGCSWRSLPAGGTLVGSVVNAGTPQLGGSPCSAEATSLSRRSLCYYQADLRAHAAIPRPSGSSSTMPAATDHRCSERGSTLFPPFVGSDGETRIPKQLPDRPAFETAAVPYLPLDGEFVPTAFVRDVLQSIGASLRRARLLWGEGTALMSFWIPRSGRFIDVD